jgi:cell wall-associated NlpC family hydrolase
LNLKLKNIVGNIFDTDKKGIAGIQKIANLKQLTNNVFGETKQSTTPSSNPFVGADGQLINPNLDYQRLLNSPKVSQTVKEYIANATGLSYEKPKVTKAKTVKSTNSSSSNSSKTSQNATTTGNSIADATTTGNSIADAAQKYLGTPYVWGGESMAEGGMDCSGFVYNALKDAGYDVGRTTAQGYRNQGTSVSKENLQPGDLIFFGKNNEASHIGIYLGDGKMIHSSGGSKNTASNPGKGVTITSVDSRGDFLGANRL